jgi:hypothetical protein
MNGIEPLLFTHILVGILFLIGIRSSGLVEIETSGVVGFILELFTMLAIIVLWPIWASAFVIGFLWGLLRGN